MTQRAMALQSHEVVPGPPTNTLHTIPVILSRHTCTRSVLAAAAMATARTQSRMLAWSLVILK